MFCMGRQSAAWQKQDSLTRRKWGPQERRAECERIFLELHWKLQTLLHSGTYYSERGKCYVWKAFVFTKRRCENMVFMCTFESCNELGMDTVLSLQDQGL